jgi:hypothetical protein
MQRIMIWVMRKITTTDMITERREHMLAMRGVIVLIHSDE